MNIDEVKAYIAQEPKESKIYLGCDSECRFYKGVWHINFYRVVVIHHNGRNGCKIFGERTSERDYTYDKKKPQHRLMKEVYKVSELYLMLSESFGDREVEVHLDLNPSKKHVSNMIVEQAIGYVKATCNVVPLIKPHAWCSSSVADKFLKIA
jgi:predicted RNase H-related nuclease YkuK (DUF458 family)